MKKRVSIPIYLLSVVAAAGISGFGVYAAGQYKATASIPQSSAVDTLDSSSFTKVHAVYQAILNNYITEIDSDDLIEGALKGMTEAVGDPYSAFLNEEATKELTEDISASFEGIGASLQLQDSYPVVAQAPIKDTPAANGGIQAGDIILQVDGKETRGSQLADVVGKIRGPKGSSVTLLIKRGQAQFALSLLRDTIPVQTVYGKLAEEEAAVGYIQLTTFAETTSTELQKTISELREQGATAFVLDLRNNPGGLLTEAEKIASYFLKDGKTIVKFATRSGIVSQTAATAELREGFTVTEPAAVLVNQNSASASEIVAAALKEAEIPIVGTATYGKGTVQTVQQIDDKTQLKLTVMKWLTPSGTWVNETGVTPTITADYPAYARLNPISREADWELGDRSEVVENLNQILTALGHETAGDRFTEATRQAVQAIQKEAALTITGKVDSATAAAIEARLSKLISEHDQAYQQAMAAVLKK